MQKIREQVLLRRDKVYQDNESEVRNRWNFEDAVSLVEGSGQKKKYWGSVFFFSHHQKNGQSADQTSVLPCETPGPPPAASLALLPGLGDRAAQ